jgi:hypothetical protein
MERTTLDPNPLAGHRHKLDTRRARFSPYNAIMKLPALPAVTRALADANKEA